MLAHLKLAVLITLLLLEFAITLTSLALAQPPTLATEIPQPPVQRIYLPFVVGTGQVITPQAYFQVGFDHNPALTFTILLTDAPTIAQARAALTQTNPTKIIIGKIITHPVSYNPPWSYHLDPATLSLAENAIEVCDGSPDYVEEHLAEAGGAFLPGYYWCPWSSRLTAELPAPKE